ncbi:MAG: pilus assembly protein PilP [Pseudomonadales bacterium]
MSGAKKVGVKFCAALCLPLLFAGCGDSGMSDLENYMQEVRLRPVPPIEPIPTFPQFDTFVYKAAGKRSPFEKPQALVEIEIEGGKVTGGALIKPDELRPKEYLEQYNISSITMVGTVTKDGVIWGLVDDGTSNIHRVQVGNYMGRNHGKIFHIDNGRIDIKEIVPSGDNLWVERPKTLQLRESAEQ